MYPGLADFWGEYIG